MVQMEIIAISNTITQTNNYAVVLQEVNGNRRLPIVIGGFEAQSIAIALEGMRPNRPLTHDLLKNVMLTFDIHLEKVIINKLIEGIFHACLICNKDGQIYEIDSRTSDAIALALRFNVPIYAREEVLSEAAITVNTPEEGTSSTSERENTPTNRPEDISRLNTAELEKLLKKCIEDENYEMAAIVRDEIKRRQENND